MRLSPRALGAVVLYALVYAAALGWLARAPGFEAGESLGVLLVFGLGYSLIAWLATLGLTPRAQEINAPARECGAVALYLALFAVLVLGFGLSALKDVAPDGPAEKTAVTLLKLLTMVVLPGWLFTRLGYSWRELLGLARFDRQLWRAFLIMAALLLALQMLIGRGPKLIAELDQPAWLIALAAPLAFAWMTIEAGLTEEFLFRLLLQARLAAWLRSETAAIAGMSLLFGLAHAPGYVLRDAHLMEGMSGPPDPLTAAAYSIAVVSPVGILFGVLWARTRSLPFVALLHGLTDTVPNLAPFVRTWLG